MASEKRVVFRSGWLPWALLAPQVIVILVFFFWPAAQALLQSFQQSDAFGISTEWVGLQNFENLLKDDTYLASFQTTAVFSVLVAGLGIGISLVLAVFGAAAGEIGASFRDPDLVALGRVLLADPDWLQKVEQGRLSELTPYDRATALVHYEHH